MLKRSSVHTPLNLRALRGTVLAIFVLLCVFVSPTTAQANGREYFGIVQLTDLIPSDDGKTVSVVLHNANATGNAIPVYLITFQAIGDYRNVPPYDASGFPELLSKQVFYDVSNFVYLAPGQSVLLRANLPPCDDAQADAMVGGSSLDPVVADDLIVMTLGGTGTEIQEKYIIGGRLFNTLDDHICEDEEGRMTGGGSVFTKGGMRVTHGFELRCHAEATPQRLQINFGGSRFHLESVTRMFCHPVQNEDGTTTYHLFGVGFGRLNGVSGAEIAFHFTDTAEPGKGIDIADIYIQDAVGQVLVVNSHNGNHLLNSGNQQWHGVK